MDLKPLKFYSSVKLGDSEDGFYLEWFLIKRVRKNVNRYGVWGFGQWWMHMMDWRGCNFWMKKLTSGQVFNSIEEAVEWIRYWVEQGVLKPKMKIDGGCNTSGSGDERATVNIRWNKNEKNDSDLSKIILDCSVSNKFRSEASTYDELQKVEHIGEFVVEVKKIEEEKKGSVLTVDMV